VAATGGLEHTLYGIFDSSADLGLLVEYLYNNNNDARIVSFENDLFLGLRLTMNDAQSTDILFGIIKDLDDHGLFYNLEASRRLGNHWKLGIQARILTHLSPGHPQYDIRDDDYIQLELNRFF